MRMVHGLIAATLAGALVAGPSNAADEKAAPSDETKVICKMEPVTGSLVKKNRVCYTRQQWKRVAENSQGIARGTVETGRGQACGVPEMCGGKADVFPF